MRIGIDISQVIYGTGSSVYTQELLHALLNIDKSNNYKLFGGSLRRAGEFRKFIPPASSNAELKTSPLSPSMAHMLWNKLHKIPMEKFLGPMDVFHSSDWTQPPSQAFKITTVHDLVPIRFPDMSHPKIVEAHTARLKWVAKEVDKIIAVSSFTKDELIDIYSIDPEKIAVIPEAPSLYPPTVNLETISKTLEKFGIDKNFFLAVGANPRKNIENIYKAFKKFKTERDGMLVVVGKPWGVAKPSIEVKFLGHVSDEDLYNLYAAADALLYVSLYEGFGLPILQAMQMGCPVVTSNVSSMPEVAGDAAVIVNPHDLDDIVEGIKKILVDRKKFVEKGIKRAKEFSWEYTAKLTLREYEKGVR